MRRSWKVNPQKLQAFDVSLQDVTEAVEAANVSVPGGFSTKPDKEMLIWGIGWLETIDDLKQSVITVRNGTLIRLSDVATVQIGAALQRAIAV